MDVTNISEYYIDKSDVEILIHIKSFNNTKLKMDCLQYNIMTNHYYDIEIGYYYPKNVILLKSNVGERIVELFFKNIDLKNQVELESKYIKMWLDLYDAQHSNKFKERVENDDLTKYIRRYYYNGCILYKIHKISQNDERRWSVEYNEFYRLDEFKSIQESRKIDINGGLFILNEDISNRIDRIVIIKQKYEVINSELINSWNEVIKGEVVELSDSSRFTYRLISELNYSSDSYDHKYEYVTRLPFISSIDDLTNLLKLNNIEHIISDSNSWVERSIFIKTIKLYYNGCTFQGSINIEDINNILLKLWRVSWRDEW